MAITFLMTIVSRVAFEATVVPTGLIHSDTFTNRILGSNIFHAMEGKRRLLFYLELLLHGCSGDGRL